MSASCGEEGKVGDQASSGELQRHFGVWQATGLNVAMIVGAGVFITIPLMLKELPGPAAMLGWLAAGALILVDGLIWSELGAALPGSGGSYSYLLESYGSSTWGRLMAFLFIWQFLLSGPLELASGLIAVDVFSQSLSPAWEAFNRAHTIRVNLWEAQNLALTLSPARAGCVGLGILLVALLWNRVTVLGRLTLALCLVVLALIAWITVEGLLHFDSSIAFDYPADGQQATNPAVGLGAAMSLALYSYLGYYTICYVGDEVRDPGRTIPRAVLISAVLVVVLFVVVHLSMLGTVSWRDVPTDEKALESYSLPAEFMKKLHGKGAVVLVSLCLIASCFAAAFAGLLGYSRIPYAAARSGHFFAAVGAVHPRHNIPHVSLLLVGGAMLFWSFFDLDLVIKALIATRILGQFVGQIVGVMLLRRTRPDLSRPFRIWLYPLPCLLALAGWMYVYCTSGLILIMLSLVTLATGVGVFLGWTYRQMTWPFTVDA
jgi:amino acid transporter